MDRLAFNTNRGGALVPRTVFFSFRYQRDVWRVNQIDP
jgi:hypothetical protein